MVDEMVDAEARGEVREVGGIVFGVHHASLITLQSSHTHSFNNETVYNCARERKRHGKRTRGQHA